DPDHRLDLLVVRRHAAAHESIRRRQALDHVDVNGGARLLEQMLGGVERRGTRPDDGDADGRSGAGGVAGAARETLRRGWGRVAHAAAAYGAPPSAVNGLRGLGAAPATQHL